MGGSETASLVPQRTGHNAEAIASRAPQHAHRAPGRRREPHARRFWLPGIIVGYAGIALAVIIWVAIGVFFASMPGGSSGTFDGGYGQS